MMVNNIFEFFIYFCIFMIGGSLSSFYHVFATRRENGENFILGRSVCDNCKKQLKFYEMIPVFSYLFLKGRCSSCKNEIGLDKFITELICSILPIIFLYKYGISLKLIFAILISVVVVFIGLIDIKTGYIHNIDLVLLLIFTVLYNFSYGIDLIQSFKYGVILFLVFFAIYFITKMMGLGDVFFAFIMGLFANNPLEGFSLFKNSFVYAAIFALIMILFKKKGPKDEIAFGPFISLSIIVFLLIYR